MTWCWRWPATTPAKAPWTRNGGVPPFAETRGYVPKVLAAWQVARGLCATVPELPSDPCVFKVAQSG